MTAPDFCGDPVEPTIAGMEFWAARALARQRVEAKLKAPQREAKWDEALSAPTFGPNFPPPRDVKRVAALDDLDAVYYAAAASATAAARREAHQARREAEAKREQEIANFQFPGWRKDAP